MSMSDDPRGFRRGQPGNRDDAASQQGRAGRDAPPRDDRYETYRQADPQSARHPEKHQPSFSAYRPEAYAAPERPPGRPERAQREGPRSAPPPPPRSLAPTSEPFPRAAQARDPYGEQSSSDPYAAPNGRGYDNDWRADPYNDQNPNQFPNYYPPEEPAGADAQSVHDRFFAAEAEQAPPPPRYQGPFEDKSFDAAQPQGYGNYPTQRHSGVHGPSSGFDERSEADWDKFDQAPAPAAVRPFHAPATIPDDDIDADFFADDDDYDAEDYAPEKKGSRTKLMAAVLVGAVVTGGGLAYVYKTSGGAGDGYPSIISADNRPVKEEPAEPGGRDFPNGNKLIYDRLGGLAQEAGAAPTRLAGGAPSSGKDTQAGTATGGTLEERIENALKAQKEDEPAAQARGGASPDAPRTVRTMTFGPDGTPRAVEPKTKRIAANDSGDALSSGVVVTTQPTSASARVEEPAETSAPAAPAERAPRQTRTAAVAQPQAAAPQLTESASGNGNFFVQIAARNDQDAAMAAFSSLQQKYAATLGNHSPSVRKVDLGEKGVWFRLLVGPIESKTEADQLCEQLKTAGMKSCFARKD
jgi:hypothetical protein